MNEKVKHIAKRVAIGIALGTAVIYTLFAIIHFNNEYDNSVCTEMEIVIKDSTDMPFIHKGDISRIVNEAMPDFKGRSLNDINTTMIERKLEKQLSAIKEVECYKTPDSKLHINVWQRQPILLVVKNAGEPYYIDSDHTIMPMPCVAPAYVPIASGNITDSFAVKELSPFAEFLMDDNFWNSQIEQIFVNSPNDVRLVPRVGGQIIEMGKLDNYEEKLDKLEKLYSEALPLDGWNNYSDINLKFENQIICTRK